MIRLKFCLYLSQFTKCITLIFAVRFAAFTVASDGGAPLALGLAAPVLLGAGGNAPGSPKEFKNFYGHLSLFLNKQTFVIDWYCWLNGILHDFIGKSSNSIVLKTHHHNYAEAIWLYCHMRVSILCPLSLHCFSNFSSQPNPFFVTFQRALYMK